MNPNQHLALVNTLIARRPNWFNNLTRHKAGVCTLANVAVGLKFWPKMAGKEVDPKLHRRRSKRDTKITPHKLAEKEKNQQAPA
jgi:hypothetical protein